MGNSKSQLDISYNEHSGNIPEYTTDAKLGSNKKAKSQRLSNKKRSQAARQSKIKEKRGMNQVETDKMYAQNIEGEQRQPSSALSTSHQPQQKENEQTSTPMKIQVRRKRHNIRVSTHSNSDKSLKSDCLEESPVEQKEETILSQSPMSNKTEQTCPNSIDRSVSASKKDVRPMIGKPSPIDIMDFDSMLENIDDCQKENLPCKKLQDDFDDAAEDQIEQVAAENTQEPVVSDGGIGSLQTNFESLEQEWASSSIHREIHDLQPNNDKEKSQEDFSDDEKASLGDLDKPDRQEELFELDQIIDQNLSELNSSFRSLEQAWENTSQHNSVHSGRRHRLQEEDGHDYEDLCDEEFDEYSEHGDDIIEGDLDFEFDRMMLEFETEENTDDLSRKTPLPKIQEENDEDEDSEVNDEEEVSHRKEIVKESTGESDNEDDQSLGNSSLFSQSDCSDYNSLGPESVSGKSYGTSVGGGMSVSGIISVSDLSLTPSTYEIVKQRKSITASLSRSSSRKSVKSIKPSANNAFETLPRHLIKSSLLRQAATTLRDERFLSRRITKLGAIYAAKVHVSDFVYLDTKMKKDAEANEAKKTSLEAHMPTSADFADGENLDSITIDSFEIFEKCVLELCGIRMVGFDDDEEIDENEDKSTDGNLDNGDQTQETSPDTVDAEENEEEEEEQEEIEPLERKIPLSDGARALYSLGKYCQKSEWDDDAIEFYKHALYLFFLHVGVEEPRLLDNSDDCDGFFYVKAAEDCVNETTIEISHYIGNIFSKMGDIHGKFKEKNDALRAYRASEVFWRKYLSDIHVENGVLSDEILKAVEALALTFNRIGGVYTAKGELDAALNSLHEGLQIQIDILGGEHIEIAKTLHNIGVCHRHNDDWDHALEYYIKAYKIFEKNLGREHLDTVRTLHNIGGVYRRKREYSKAMECFREVLVVRRKALGDDHPSVSITLVSMAAVLRRSGKKEEANKFYAAAVH